MTDIRASLLHAAQEAGVTHRFQPVRHPRWQGLLQDILSRFANTPSPERPWLWNDLRDAPTCYRLRSAAETLEVLPGVLGERAPVWFVAEDSGKQDAVFWVFDTDSDAAVRVLAHHPLVEYYVVDRHLRWLVGEMHHDVLLAVGEPVAGRIAALRG